MQVTKVALFLELEKNLSANIKIISAYARKKIITWSLYMIYYMISIHDLLHDLYAWFITWSLYMIYYMISIHDLLHDLYTWFITWSLYIIYYMISIHDLLHDLYTWFITWSLYMISHITWFLCIHDFFDYNYNNLCKWNLTINFFCKFHLL